MTHLYLIRHAESEYNATQLYIGGRSPHLKLSFLGEEQARKLGRRFRDEGYRFDGIFSSDAERAKRTALIACETAGFSLDSIVFSDRLQERSAGTWEGRLISEIYTPEQQAIIDKDVYNFTYPCGESSSDAEERMHSFIAEHIVGRDGAYAIFTHGLAIRCLLRRLKNAPRSYIVHTFIHNASITHAEHDILGWQVHTQDDVAHLE